MRSRPPDRAGAFGSLPAPIPSHRVVSRPRCMPAGFPRRVQAGGSNAPVTGPGTLSSAAARPSSIVVARSIPAPREDRPPAPRYAPRRNHVSEQAGSPRRLAPVRFDTAPDRLCECGIGRFRAVAVLGTYRDERYAWCCEDCGRRYSDAPHRGLRKSVCGACQKERYRTPTLPLFRSHSMRPGTPTSTCRRASCPRRSASWPCPSRCATCSTPCA